MDLALPWAGVNCFVTRSSSCEDLEEMREVYAVEKSLWLDPRRYLHFLRGRKLLHEVLQLRPPQKILRREDGKPEQPVGYLVSVSHTETATACLVARGTKFHAVGVDVVDEAEVAALAIPPGVTGLKLQGFGICQEIAVFEAAVKVFGRNLNSELITVGAADATNVHRLCYKEKEASFYLCQQSGLTIGCAVRLTP